MRERKLQYDPGSLPLSAEPHAGDTLELGLEGWPPWKDEHRSIRNRRHPDNERFVALRKAAEAAMAGRTRYSGPIGLELEMRGPGFEPKRSLNDYLGGICDTLDGSHGPSFTYLPIVYEDDCQVAEVHGRLVEAPEPSYTVRVEFLSHEGI